MRLFVNLIICSNSYFADLVGVETVFSALCQIQTAIIAVVATVLTVGITLSEKKYYGISGREYLELQKSRSFLSIIPFIIIEILILLISVYSLLTKLYIINIIMFSISTSYCIAICIHYSLVFKDERGIRKLINNGGISKIVLKSSESKINEDKINVFLQEYVIMHGIKVSLDNLCSKTNESENARIRARLIEILKGLAVSIDQATSDDETMKLFQNIYWMIENTPDEENDLSYNNIFWFASSLIVHMNHYSSRNNKLALSLFDFFESAVLYIDYVEEKNAKMLARILIYVLKDSLENKNTRILAIYRDIISQNINFSERNSRSAALFSKVQMYLFYFCRVDGKVPKEISKTVEDFMGDESSERMHYKTKSMTELFDELTSSFDFDLKYYLMNTGDIYDLEFIIYNIVTHAVLEDKFVVDWWYKMWIMKNRYFYDEIIESYEKESTEFLTNVHLALSPYCNDDDMKYNISTSLKDVYSLFGVAPIENERLEVALFSLKNVIFQTINERQLHRIDETVIKEFDKQVFVGLSKMLSEMEFNSSKNETKLEEQSFLIYHSSLSSCFENNEKRIIMTAYSFLVNTIRSQINGLSIINMLEVDPNALCKTLGEINPVFYTRSILPYANRHSFPLILMEQISDIEKEAKQIKGEIFENYTYIGENAVDIQVELYNVNTQMLSGDELEQRVNLYLRQDGTYYYDGMYGNHENAKKFISNKYCKTEIKYGLNVKCNPIKWCVVDIMGLVTKRIEKIKNSENK